jgi:hypothetical protein
VEIIIIDVLIEKLKKHQKIKQAHDGHGNVQMD